MLTCHHCRHEFDAPEAGATAICPHCRSEVRAPEEASWVSVVRTVNLAEAGYLANELEMGGFCARIKQHDSFSALDGSWTSLFLIQVPDDVAQESADHLRTYLEEADFSGSAAALADAADGSHRGGPVWRPLALMVVAGVAVLFIGQRMRELRARQHEPSRAGLLTALEQIDRPFVSVEPGKGKGRFRLLFSRHAQLWRLQEDMNGDGRYDREWMFREHATAR
jgi:hypothetical protein